MDHPITHTRPLPPDLDDLMRGARRRALHLIAIVAGISSRIPMVGAARLCRASAHEPRMNLLKVLSHPPSPIS